ncbi:hypothetical protein DN545_36515, partial [Burkholderia multivorans]
MSERAAALFREVEEDFRATGSRTPRWEDPHLDPEFEWGGGPAPDGWSDVTDHEKFAIVHARARAWINVLARRGIRVADHPVYWASDDPFLSVADRSAILTSDVEGNPELVIGFND